MKSKNNSAGRLIRNSTDRKLIINSSSARLIKNNSNGKLIKWTASELRILNRLSAPEKIQFFLDSVPYSTDSIYRSPRSVLHDRKAHCFDGAVFAAAALSEIGFPPLIMELKAVRDDDHMLALFKRNGYWGALGKSNCAGLRYREPIFRTLRELALSYFEFYFNIKSEKTLRGYSVSLNISIFDEDNWKFLDETMDLIADKLDMIRHYSLLTRAMTARLAVVDSRTYAAGMYGADEEGLFDPDK